MDDSGGEQMRSCHYGSLMSLQSRVQRMELTQQNILATLNHLPGQQQLLPIATQLQVVQCEMKGVVASLKDIRVKQEELERQQQTLGDLINMVMDESVADHGKLVNLIIDNNL